MFVIFDLTFSKIVDPTIFVWESFIYAVNSLARRVGVFFARNSFARRAQFLRPSRANSSARKGGGDRSPSSPREERRRRVKKGGSAQGKEKSRVWRGVVSRETTAMWGVRVRQGVQDSRDIKIVKPLYLCKNIKFGPSNTKFAKMHKSNTKLFKSNF